MQKTGIYPRAEWIGRTNIYEVNIRQYTPEGTFSAFAAHLTRLRQMGVETLWLMPVTPIAQQEKKGSLGSPYACSDYTAVNAEFGTLEDLRSLVKQAHEAGFKLIIDWVANHTGWDHVWTKSNPDFYKRNDDGTFRPASGMDDIIELDYSNPALRRAMINAMKFWIDEIDLDGFRCDLASWVELDFWKDARTALEPVKNMLWLAELDPVENPDFMQVFDAAYAWKWMHGTEDFYKRSEPVEKLRSLLHDYDQVISQHGIPMWFTSNHDENSWNGTEYEKYGEMALPLAVHSLTWDGIPLVYSGQELPNYKRLRFFDKDVIEWKNDLSMAPFYHTLLSLRKRNTALSGGDPTSVTTIFRDAFADGVLVYKREKNEQAVLVFLNMTNKPQVFNFDGSQQYGHFYNVFYNEGTFDLPAQMKIELKPWQYLVFEKA